MVGLAFFSRSACNGQARINSKGGFMPLGESVREFELKATSVKPTDLGGGQTRIEITYAGKVTGDPSGQHFGTLTVTVGAIDQPNPWTYLGAILTPSGSIVKISGQGLGIRTGDGHKARYRGTICSSTEDPKFTQLNKVILATEFEVDPTTQLLKGANCVWK
jgi:hypothetical protein